MTLPASTNLKYFSASVMNDYAAALLAAYDWAIGPQFPFCGSLMHDEWSGYILHTSNVFRYSYYRATAGTTTIEVNGVTILTSSATGTVSGTVTVAYAALNLTVGQVYTVIVQATGGHISVWWLGESKTINYTAPPTFADTNVLTAANLETLRTGIVEIESALNWPLPPVILAREKDQCRGYNEYKRVTQYSFYFAGHDLFNYRFSHGTLGVNVSTKVYLNGTQIYGKNEHAGERLWAGAVDISALGLSLGTIYSGYVTVEHGGTSHSAQVHNNWYLASLETATACAPPPVWAHGGTAITAANLNLYSAIINAIHPAAPSPTYPLYYEQPAVIISDTNEYFLQHRRRWLRYKGTGNTVTIKYGPNLKTKADVASGSSAHASFDLGQLPGLTIGSYYSIDDCHYAQEWTSSQ